MIIPKNDFKNAIDAVSPLARAKSTLQILTNVKIESTGKRITFTASTIDSQIEYWFDCEGEKFACCIEAATLKKFAQFCDGDVSFAVKGKKAVLEFGDTKTRLNTLEAQEFPVLKQSEKLLAELDWEPIGARIHFATQFCGAHAKFPQCTCVQLKSKGDQIEVFALDGITLSVDVVKQIAPEFGICIQAETARNMVGPFRTLVVREEQLELRGPNSIALFKTAPYAPLDLSRMIGVNLPNAGMVDRKSFLDAIQFVSSFSDQGKIRGMVRVEAGESNVVRLAGAGNEAAAPFEYEGDGLAFAAFHDDWSQFLKAMEVDKLKIQFNKDDLLGTQIRLSDADRMILTMPARI